MNQVISQMIRLSTHTQVLTVYCFTLQYKGKFYICLLTLKSVYSGAGFYNERQNPTFIQIRMYEPTCEHFAPKRLQLETVLRFQNQLIQLYHNQSRISKWCVEVMLRKIVE